MIIVMIVVLVIVVAIVLGLYFGGVFGGESEEETTETTTTTTLAPTTSAPTGAVVTTTAVTIAPKLMGRYVMIKNDIVSCMHVVNVAVISNGTNVAVGKPVTVSSSNSDKNKYKPANLVDGDDTTMMHTSCKDKPWMKIDLLQTFGIDKIILTNRWDGCGNRIYGTYIQVLDEKNKVVFQSNKITSSSGSTKYQNTCLKETDSKKFPFSHYYSVDNLLKNKNVTSSNVY
jgi:hypothetical protein